MGNLTAGKTLLAAFMIAGMCACISRQVSEQNKVPTVPRIAAVDLCKAMDADKAKALSTYNDHGAFEVTGKFVYATPLGLALGTGPTMAVRFGEAQSPDPLTFTKGDLVVDCLLPR